MKTVNRALRLLVFLFLLSPLGEASASSSESKRNSPSLETHPTPFTTLIDFALLRSGNTPPESLPVWLESIQIDRSTPLDLTDDPDSESIAITPQKREPECTYRIRLRSLPGLSDALLVRLIYDDKPEHPIILTGWSETGLRLYHAELPNLGLNLPTSETFKIPTQGIDYLEIRVRGDGSLLRQAFLTTLKKKEIHYALDFLPSPLNHLDPFEAPLPSVKRGNDQSIFGRIRAPLSEEMVTLTPTATNPQPYFGFSFHLEAQPLLALVTLEIHNASPSFPLQVWINDHPVGPLSPTFPDLSDPAFTGVSRPLLSISFIYAGWLNAQVPIGGQHLRKGENRLIIQLPERSTPAAIRSLEIQLKYPWRKLDYILAPTPFQNP